MILGMRQSLASSPVVQALFAAASNDYTTLSTTSSMPSGGLITRAGNAMLYDSTGKLTYAPNNLFLYSGDLTNAVWNGLSPSGSTTTNTITFTGSGNDYRYQIPTIVTGINYMFSGLISGPAGQKIVVRASSGSSTGNQVITLSATPTPFVYIWNATTSSPAIGFANTVATGGDGLAKTITVSSLALSNVTYETSYRPGDQVITTTSAYYGPRFDYDPATLAAKGLLVEGTRTNLIQSSGDLSTAQWSQSSVTVGTKTSSPDGLTNGVNLAPSSSNSYTRTSATISVSTNTVYTFSVWLKSSGASRTLSIGIYDTGLSTLLGSSTITVTSDWQRFSASANVASNSSVYCLIGGAFSWTTGEDLIAWGAQLEAGSFATSYIPTVASSVARAAETFTLANYQNRLVESFYIDEQTGGSWSANINASATSPLTISTPTFGWVTSLRPYTNAYAGDITTPSWIDNSGTTGNRMYYDSTGALTYGPNNLLQYTEDLTNTYWGKNAGITVSQNSGYATITVQNTVTSGTNIFYRQSVYNGGTIVNSVEVRCATGQQIAIADDYGLATYTMTSDWQRIYLSATGSGWHQFYIRTSANLQAYSFDIRKPQLELVTYQTSPRAYIPTTSAAVYQPRYDYDPSVTPATPRGMLIEESRVNTFTGSQVFSGSGWFQDGISLTTGGIAPDGTNTAISIVQGTGANRTYQFDNSNVTGSKVFSLFAKSNAGSVFTVSFTGGVSSPVSAVTVNLANQTVTGTTYTGSMTYVGNGWYRVFMPCTITTASGNATYIVMNGPAASVYIWGAQLEAGSFATSYIPTTTGSVTRVADVVKWTSAAFSSYWNATQGTVAVQVNRVNISGRFMSAYNASNVRLIDIFFSSATSVANFSSCTGGGQFDFSTATVPSTGQVRAVFGYALNNFGGSVNGQNVASDTTIAVDVTATTVALGGYPAGSNTLNGHIQSFAYYNQRLPDATLKIKSVVGAPY